MGPGISLATARRFGRAGFDIAMIARRKSYLDKLTEELDKEGYAAHGFEGDAADFDSLRQAFTQIKKQLGHTSLLLYNVSVYREAVPTQLDPETAMQDFRANVGGALVAVQEVAGNMREQKAGTILITGGGTAVDPFPLVASLGIGKAGIRNLSMNLAAELEPHGIHVATVTVCGMVAPETRYAPELIAEEFWKLYRQPQGEFQHEVIYR